MRGPATFLALMGVLAGLAGCSLVPAECAPAEGEPAHSCPEVANEQGCPLTDPGTTAADDWCRDDFAPLLTHVGAAACYRGYGEEAGSQCCYNADGCLIGDDEVGAGTADLIGPAAGEVCDGTCNWLGEPLRVGLHWVFDVLLAGHASSQ